MKHRLELLELLRFLLALNVVFYHYFYIGPLGNWIGGPSVPLPYLLFSVHAFFVVSGFVIMFSATDRTWDQFVVARIARLGPSLLVCGTATFVALWILPLEPVHIRVVQWVRSVLVVPLATGGGVDLSYWSLKYEIIFYALVAALIWRGLTPGRLLFLVSLMLASDCISFIVGYAGGNVKWSPTNTYGAFFCIGILFYLGRNSVEPRTLWPFWVATLIVAGIDAFIDLRSTEVDALHQPAPEWWVAPLIALAIVPIVGLFLGGIRAGFLSRAFRVLGMASYPLYLIHQELGYWAIGMQEKIFGLDVGAARAITIVVMVGFAIVFSMTLEPILTKFYSRNGSQLLREISLRTSRRAART
jgi:peptidoglycan/LPS O-acetylase OafA/YrhL